MKRVKQSTNIEMNIEFKKLKQYVTTGEMTEEYRVWRDSDPRNVELEARVRNYYDEHSEEHSEFIFTSRDAVSGLEELEQHRDIDAIMTKQQKRRRRSLTSRLVVTASVAAAMIFITFNVYNANTSKEEQVIAQVGSEHNSADNLAIDFTTQITLTTNDGKKFTPKKDVSSFDLREESLENIFEFKTQQDAEQVDYTAMNVISVPKGKCFDVTLSDGTLVHINSLSTLEYPAQFDPAAPREVKINGEAFFDVAKSITQQFIVEAKGLKIRVYGTKFNVNTYFDNVVNTVLVEGSISAQVEGKKEKMLKESELLSYNDITGDVSVREVDTRNYTSWIDGVYRFSQWSLGDIASSISLWYNVDIKFKDTVSRDLLYICNLPRDYSVDEVLDVLSTGGNIGYSIVDNKVTIWSLYN